MPTSWRVMHTWPCSLCSNATLLFPADLTENNHIEFCHKEKWNYQDHCHHSCTFDWTSYCKSKLFLKRKKRTNIQKIPSLGICKHDQVTFMWLGITWGVIESSFVPGCSWSEAHGRRTLWHFGLDSSPMNFISPERLKSEISLTTKGQTFHNKKKKQKC